MREIYAQAAFHPEGNGRHNGRMIYADINTLIAVHTMPSYFSFFRPRPSDLTPERTSRREGGGRGCGYSALAVTKKRGGGLSTGRRNITPL